MRTSTRVAVRLLLGLLTIQCAIAKEDSTAPAAATSDKTHEAAPLLPPPKTGRKPLLQQIRENPTKFGDHDQTAIDHKKVTAPAVRGKFKLIRNTSSHRQVIPPTRATKKHVLQDVKENPLKYNDARPEHKGVPGQKERPQDQY